MSRQKDQSQKILTDELLSKELHLLAEKKIISQRIAEKIKEKIQTNHLTLNQNDLIKLIEHIQVRINTRTPDHQNVLGESKEPVFGSGAEKVVNEGKNDNSNETNIHSPVIQTRGGLPAKGSIHKYYLSDQSEDLQNQLYISDSTQHPMEPLRELIYDAEHIVVLLKWLSYLIEKIGKNQLPTLLDYYVDIHWISENVCTDLLTYAKGLSGEKTERKETEKTLDFTMDDHLQSLFFIQRLKGASLSQDFLWRIDHELERMERSLHQKHQSSVTKKT